MLPITREWVKKAEGDFTTANREWRARRSPNYDAACYHAQQCAEKYLKARLQEAGIHFRKTHNLITLLDLLLPVEPGLELMRPLLQVLNTYAVMVRYPGESATKSRAKAALAQCREVRQRMRNSLGLKP